MKFGNAILLIITSTIILYAIFLFVADFNLIQEKISNFKINYLPLILFLVTLSLIPIFIKWNFLLKNCEIEVPLAKSLAVFLSGLAFDITPGKIGALMKSQILKISSDIPRAKTAPVVLVEKMYDLIGAIVASIIGIIILGVYPHLIVIAVFILAVIFFFMFYRPASELFFKRITKTKFLSKSLFVLGLLNTSADSIILLLINSWTRFFTSGDTLIFDLFSLLGKLLQPNNIMSIR